MTPSRAWQPKFCRTNVALLFGHETALDGLWPKAGERDWSVRSMPQWLNQIQTKAVTHDLCPFD
jgi:hypothetical protein